MTQSFGHRNLHVENEEDIESVVSKNGNPALEMVTITNQRK